MSKILANQIANYGDNAPIEIKEGLNIPAGKPIQAAGSSGTSGQVLTSTGSSIGWTTPFDGDYNSLFNKPTIPAAQVNSDWNSVSGASRILNKPVVPAVPSVTTASASGSGSLSYNSLNGEFTFTPPNLSSYLTSYTETDPVFAASEASSITSTDTSNWDTAYGWGNHASSGYLTSTGSINTHTDVDTTTTPPSNGQVLKWNGSQWAPANDLTAEGVGIGLTDLSSVTLAPSASSSLSYNNETGVFTYTPPNLSGYVTSESDPVFSASPAGSITAQDKTNWNTSYGWGNHASSGYLVATSTDKSNWDTAYGWGDHGVAGYLTTETDPVFSASIAASITTTDVLNWNTAYGWGDHASGGYLTALGSISGHSDVTITTPTSGQLLSYNGSQWVNSTVSNIANATISDTAPGGASVGDLWWESDTGRLKILYNDTDTTQWVDASPPLQQDRIATSAAPATATSTGTAGEIRYDSGYVYICVATNTWKRAALTTW